MSLLSNAPSANIAINPAKHLQNKLRLRSSYRNFSFIGRRSSFTESVVKL